MFSKQNKKIFHPKNKAEKKTPQKLLIKPTTVIILVYVI